jgi:2-hydroxychromene-2-carboxylate isomerase
MLKCSSAEARAAARAVCRESATAWEFLSFIHRNLHDEEGNHYAKEDWIKVARELGLQDIPADKSLLIARVRESGQDYRKLLRSLH